LLGCARGRRNRCGGERRQRLRGVQLRSFDARLDCLDADGFKYVITANELTAA